MSNIKTISSGGADSKKNAKTQFLNAKYHFIGAGGIGMSGLAKVFLNQNAQVEGSDMTQTPVTEKLNAAGASIKIGHKAENLDEKIDKVVISAAVTEDNPELRTARKRGIEVYKYAQMLGLLMDHFNGVAICGTHGKSTTGGWLVQLLKQIEIDVNFIIGAEICQLGTNSGTGKSDYFIAEACEYDRSFLNLRPKIAVMLNVEADHLDIYGSEENVVQAFTEFAAQLGKDGLLIANAQDPNIKKILNKVKDVKVELFGFDSALDYYADNISLENGCYCFDVFHNQNNIGRAKLNVPGRHNILNALAVVAAAINCKADPAAVIDHLGDFTGIDRRLNCRGVFNGITVIDDYAHHPTEIKASLSAIRERYQFNKLWCVYQPHQYSRTKFLLDDFAKSFILADITVIPDIYFVRDVAKTRQDVNAQMLVDKICAQGANAVFVDGFEKTINYIKQNVKNNDLVVIMGAGNIWKVADEYIQWLKRNS